MMNLDEFDLDENQINSNNYNQKVDYSIYWLGAGDELDQSRIERLNQNHIQVRHFSDQDQLMIAIDKSPPNMLAIANYSDLTSCIEIGIKIKKLQANSNIHFMMITPRLDEETKDYFYQNGGSELLLEPASLIEIFFRIQQEKLNFDHKNNADIQIEEASQMALLAMENSSDLGSTINFVKSATRCTDYQSLAMCIFDAVKVYSDLAVIEMVGAKSNYYFSSTQTDPLSVQSFDLESEKLKEFLIENKSETRIVQDKDFIQMNHPHLIVTAKGLPVDDICRMGRIADNLAILCDTADRFTSELLLREKTQLMEQTKKRFISSISHELNTPMNAILGFSQLISARGPEQPMGDKGVLALESIVTNSEKMKSIIEKLNQVTNDSLANENLSKSHFEILPLLADLERSFINVANSKNIELQIPKDCTFTLNSNQQALQKVLNNLLENALKFIEKGSVVVKVNAIHSGYAGDSIQFSIIDTGIGISEVNLDGIFDQIGQLDTSHDRQSYGAGLGLYFVQSLVKQLEGSVEVKSQLGVGSEFIVTIPTNIKNEVESAELF